MTMADKFQVVGECAYVTAPTVLGTAKTLLYKGAMVPAEAPELGHLLDTGLVAEVGGEETGGVNADGVTTFEAERKAAEEAEAKRSRRAAKSDGDQGGGPDTDAAAVQARREAAAAKLPTDGTAPDGRASKETWVEYGVKQGRDRAALEALSKDELQAELKPKG